ncbi:hypothetical protein GWI33_006359 [Rhynchophorus ferrugineus]|uniref:Uncharacterized protein n=1 Tax=Rhynchophorus ferrugineus TaxID=354439 RepID=A0A834MMQ3_RHYFE|nr:hypothetical protein GWI33_006359 [Rhynchophorus ferrugineus]
MYTSHRAILDEFPGLHKISPALKRLVISPLRRRPKPHTPRPFFAPSEAELFRRGLCAASGKCPLLKNKTTNETEKRTHVYRRYLVNANIFRINFVDVKFLVKNP